MKLRLGERLFGLRNHREEAAPVLAFIADKRCVPFATTRQSAGSERRRDQQCWYDSNEHNVPVPGFRPM